MIHVTLSEAAALLTPLTVLFLGVTLQGDDDDFFLYLSTLGAMAVIVYILKAGIGAPRPAGALVPETGSAFPSHHAALGFFPLGFFWQRAAGPDRTLLILFGLASAYARLVLRVHFPVDVVAGGLLGLSVGYLAVRKGEQIVDFWKSVGLRRD